MEIAGSEECRSILPAQENATVIYLTGGHRADPVGIDPNYLRDPRDLKDLIRVSTAREIGNSSSFSSAMAADI